MFYWHDICLTLPTQMRTLLHKADTSAKQADTHLDFRRPDLAYIEYLTAFSIVVNSIPRHKDFPELSHQRGELWRLNKGLQQVCYSSYIPNLNIADQFLCIEDQFAT